MTGIIVDFQRITALYGQCIGSANRFQRLVNIHYQSSVAGQNKIVVICQAAGIDCAGDIGIRHNNLINNSIDGNRELFFCIEWLVGVDHPLAAFLGYGKQLVVAAACSRHFTGQSDIAQNIRQLYLTAAGEHIGHCAVCKLYGIERKPVRHGFHSVAVHAGIQRLSIAFIGNMINLRFQIVVLRFRKPKAHLHALCVGRLYLVVFRVQHLDVKGIGDCNICICIAFIFNSLVHHALGRNRNALHGEIGALREYSLRCANSNRYTVYCLGIVEGRMIRFDFCPLGVDLDIPGNGCGKVKSDHTGAVLKPAAEGESFFGGVLRLLGGLTFLNLLLLHLGASVHLKGNGIGSLLRISGLFDVSGFLFFLCLVRILRQDSFIFCFRCRVLRILRQDSLLFCFRRGVLRILRQGSRLFCFRRGVLRVLRQGGIIFCFRRRFLLLHYGSGRFIGRHSDCPARKHAQHHDEGE